MNILIGTKNPGKIQGAKEAFDNYFNDIEVIGIPVSSDVSDEPVDSFPIFIYFSSSLSTIR